MAEGVTNIYIGLGEGIEPIPLHGTIINNTLLKQPLQYNMLW